MRDFRGGNTGALWLFMHLIQYLSFIPLMSLDLPSTLSEFLGSLFKFRVLPNVFRMFVSESDVESSTFSEAEE
jgi:hypothetical protein